MIVAPASEISIRLRSYGTGGRLALFDHLSIAIDLALRDRDAIGNCRPPDSLVLNSFS